MPSPLPSFGEGPLLVMKTHDMAQVFLARLDENASTPAEKQTAADVRTVVEAQNKIIAKLMEHNLEIIDMFDGFLAKIDTSE